MQEAFLQYIIKHHLLIKGDRILLAVSGGIDSMVLVDLFVKSGFDLAIVHVNHQLRGEESEQDYTFVKKYCADHSITFFGEKISEGLLTGSGLQVKARMLRYRIFEEIAAKNGYDKIATAHHKDDILETFFMNGLRGAGLSGLTGIPIKNGKVIRPLLFASKEEIADYAKANSILFREDSSNDKSVYTRNFIRNRILPEFDTIDYRKREGFYTTISNLYDDHQLFQEMIDAYGNSCISRKGDVYLFDIKPIQHIQNKVLMLYVFLKKFGFNKTQIEDLYDHQVTGNFVKNEQFILSIERDIWMIRPVDIEELKEGYIEINELPVTVSAKRQTITFTKENKLPDGEPTGIDIAKLKFPLCLRNWKNTDVFRPLEMKGSKKEIKKILSEEKIPSFLKKEVQVLVDASGEVVAVIGSGISQTFASSTSRDGFLLIKTDLDSAV